MIWEVLVRRRRYMKKRESMPQESVRDRVGLGSTMYDWCSYPRLFSDRERGNIIFSHRKYCQWLIATIDEHVAVELHIVHRSGILVLEVIFMGAERYSAEDDEEG